MATQTGRTVGKFVKFQLDDSAGTKRDIPVTSINGVGLTYPEVDVSAIQDAVKGMLNGQPDYVLEIGGPLDNSAAQAASGKATVSALSGSHTVLSALPDALTPLGFAVYCGIRQTWNTGEPAFGIAGTAANGIICMNYNVDVINSTYTASFRMYPGSAAPAWGTSVIT